MTKDSAFEKLAAQVQEWSDGKSDRELYAIVRKWLERGYARGNGLLIEMQRPDATDLREHHEWTLAGRTVDHGEKSIKILRKGERYRSPTRMRQYIDIVHLFDISQTHPTE